MEYPPYSPDMTPNDLRLFPKIKSAFRDEDFRMLRASKKCDDGNERCSTTGVIEIFPTVAATLC